MELESLQPEIKKLGTLTTTYSTLVQAPNYIGGYRIGEKSNYNVQFNLTRKPSFIHRFLTKLFLGWIWVDNKN